MAHPVRNQLRIASFWFCLGLLGSLGVVLGWFDLNARNLGRLLYVGEHSDLRTVIEQDYGEPIHLTERTGHDAQWSYLVARDPFMRGEFTSRYREFPRHDLPYRFRRVLYPLLAGLGGVLSPRSIVYGLVIVAALGVGLATAATSLLCQSSRAKLWMPLLVFSTPGVLLSVLMLTSDALAIGLMLVAFVFLRRGQLGPALTTFAAMALTKEVLLLAPLSLAIIAALERDTPRALKLAIAPIVPLLLWSQYVNYQMPPISGGWSNVSSNLALPFLGISAAFDRFASAESFDQFLTVTSVALLALAALVPLVRRDWRAGVLSAPWVILSIFCAPLVWQYGFDSARAFAPLFILFLVSVSDSGNARQTVPRP